MTKSVLPVGLLAVAAFGAFGQEGGTAPEFEAASVKPAAPLNTGALMAGGSMRISMGCSRPDPGRFTCSGMPLRMLLARAYGLKNYQVFGPSWIDSERFDINAKIPAGATQEQLNPMLQKLLADRFQMTVHRETKDLPIYALVVGKNGPKLKESTGDAKGTSADDALAGRGVPPPPSGGGGQQAMMVVRSDSGGAGGGKGLRMRMRNGLSEITGTQATVSNLANMLSTQLNRPVVDETDLKGEYDITLDFAPDDTVRPGGASGAFVFAGPGPVGGAASGTPGAEAREPSSAPSIFSAVQNQLGLKLEPKKAPVETIVVDKAEKLPAEN